MAAPGVVVDAALLERAGDQLRIVANYAVGVDNVDLEAAAARGVVVTNTPDVLTDATAELTLALLLALLRRVVEGDRLIRRGDPWRWEPTFMPGPRAGRAAAAGRRGRAGSAAGSPPWRRRSGWRCPLPVARTTSRALLGQADAVTLHVPLTEETRGLIGSAELRAMRSDAVLVNTSRGAVLDEAALVAALEAGELAGAALDVFEHEPDCASRACSTATTSC